MYYTREGFHSDNEKPRQGQAYTGRIRGERPLLSRTIFLYHIFKINLTLVCYGRSIEVRKIRKIGKLLLERHKGGRDRLIEVAARVFSFLQLFRDFDYPTTASS